MTDGSPTAQVLFCVVCGKPAVGRFELFYANERANQPMWTAPQACCEAHRAIYEEAGNTPQLVE